MQVEHGGVVYVLNTNHNTAKAVAYRAENIYEIIIPQTVRHWMCNFTVTEIADCAFQYSDIRKITLPYTIGRIGQCAFMGSKISYIFRNSTTPIIIEDSAFVNCTELVRANFQGMIRLMGDNQFHNCFKLESIDDYNIKGRIGQWTFAGCLNLTEFHLADVIVEKNSFENTNLNQIFIGENVKISGEIKHVFNTMNILCLPDSNLLDLVYEGYCVHVIDNT